MDHHRVFGWTVSLALLAVVPLVIALTTDLAIAQAPNLLWAARYGGPGTDWPDDGAATLDGGCIVTGMTTVTGAAWDCYVLRFTPAGDTAWTMRYGGAYGDYGRDIVSMSDGSFYVLGKSQTAQNGDYFVTLRQIDSLGKSLWYKVTNRTENPWGLCVTPDSGFAVAGSYESSIGAKNEVAVIRYSAKGDTVWSRRIGGPENDDGRAIIAMPDSGFLVLANTYSFGATYGDIYLIRLSSNGTVLWTTTFGDTNHQYGHRLEPTSDGNSMIVGSSVVPSRSGQVYMIKIRPDGSTIWSRAIGGTASEDARSVCRTPDGGYLLAGLKYMGTAKQNDMYLLRVNSEGDSLWSTTVGSSGHEYASVVHALPDGCTLCIGQDQSVYDIMVAKFTASATGIDVSVVPLPSRPVLFQNYPNPFNPTTVISCQLPVASQVKLLVYDLLGREVATLADGWMTPGRHDVTFDATTLPSGVYISRMSAGRYVESRKMLLVR